MNLGHFVTVRSRLCVCVFISATTLHFKEFVIQAQKHCRFWVSQARCIFPQLTLVNINAFFYFIVVILTNLSLQCEQNTPFQSHI